jgi:hypothetical protein
MREEVLERFAQLEPGALRLAAICGAFFVTSSIHGNCSRLMAFSWRRSASCDGAGSAGSAWCAIYCRRHSDKAQL